MSTASAGTLSSIAYSTRASVTHCSKNARSVNGQIEALVRLATVKADDERGASAALDRAIHVYAARKNQLISPQVSCRPQAQ